MRYAEEWRAFCTNVSSDEQKHAFESAAFAFNRTLTSRSSLYPHASYFKDLLYKCLYGDLMEKMNFILNKLEDSLIFIMIASLILKKHILNEMKENAVNSIQQIYNQLIFSHGH